jgi:hypothetical protein
MKIKIIHSSQTESAAVLVGVVAGEDTDGNAEDTEYRAEVPLLDANGNRKPPSQVKDELLTALRKSVSPHIVQVGEEIEV